MNVQQYYKRTFEADLFFDKFDGGLGGLSFRKLKSNHTGRWGRARNVATSEERDIFFDSSGLVADVADILDLSNGTDTVELIAYDNSFLQIYFGADVTSGRPLLVSSGTLIQLGGKPAFGLSDTIRRVSISLNALSQDDPQPLSIFSLAKIDTLRQRNFTLGTYSRNLGYWHGGTLTGYDGIGANLSDLDIHSLNDENTNRRLGSYFWTGANELKIGSNGGTLSTFSTTVGAPLVRNIGVGQIASAQSFSGIIQEILLFETNKFSDYAEIFADLNNYYSII